MIGRLEKTVIDCPDPRSLAKFFCTVLGMQINQNLPGWVVIGLGHDRRDLAFQRVRDYSPPTWPEPSHPQQMHLDIRVEDTELAETVLLALGARRMSSPAEVAFGTFRTFLDPAGHPLCIVFGRPPRGPVRPGRADG